jgi:hypothetical protein
MSTNGVGECGVYTYEVAETKVTQVMDFARRISIRCNALWKRNEEPPVPTFSRSLEKPCIARWPMPMSAARIRHAGASAAGADGRQDAAGVMQACSVDIDQLRGSLATMSTTNWRT